MKKNKYFMFAICLSLCTILASCTSNNVSPTAQSSQPQAQAGTGPTEYSLPLVTDGSVTISIATTEMSVAGFTYESGLEIWKKFEEDTGVKVEWQAVNGYNDYMTVMQTRLAAGSDLPDFMLIPPNNPMKYVTDGLILPLTEQLNKNGYYTTQLYEQNPYLKPYVTAPDGEYYFFTTDVYGTALADPYVYLIREDWLKKSNLGLPETLDDWYVAWKSFLDNDANGNGLRDEIPFMNGNLLDGIKVFGSAYGLQLRVSAGFSVDASGKVQYDYTKPEMKDFFAWLNKCYSEDLIDKEFATQTYDMNLQKVTADKAGSIHRFLNGYEIFNKILIDAGIESGKFTVANPPMKSKDSTIPRTVERYGPTEGIYGFTKDVKDFDIKFKFIDYVTASKQGNYATCSGVEGKTYEIVNDVPVFTDYAVNNPDGRTINDLLRTLGAQPSFVWYRSLNGYWSHQPKATIQHLPEVIEIVDRYQEFLFDAFPHKTLLTEDEQAILGKYITDIQTYRDEMFTKFVMGTEPLSNFDQYVKDLQAMGLDKVLEVRQSQYERYLKVK